MLIFLHTKRDILQDTSEKYIGRLSYTVVNSEGLFDWKLWIAHVVRGGGEATTPTTDTVGGGWSQRKTSAET